MFNFNLDKNDIQNMIYNSSFPSTSIHILLIICIFQVSAHFLLSFTSATFASLNRTKKRNIITYIAELLVTSIALVVQIYVSKDILFGSAADTGVIHDEEASAESNVERSKEWLLSSLQWVSILYIWEFFYKIKFGKPFLWHHILTLLGIQLILAALRDDGDNSTPPSSSSPSQFYLKCALIMGFHATTDQTSYLALLLYHFRKSSAADSAFIVASIDRIIFKVVLFVGGVYLYTTELLGDALSSGMGGEWTNWDKFWIVSFIPLTFIQSTILFF